MKSRKENRRNHEMAPKYWNKNRRWLIERTSTTLYKFITNLQISIFKNNVDSEAKHTITLY